MERPLATIGLIGDVHQEDRRLEAALARLSSEGVDTIACVGDLADGAGDLARCCRLLEEAGALVVRGNHDRWLLAGTMRDLPDAHPPFGDCDDPARRYLASLPGTRELSTVIGPMLLCHGLGSDDMATVMPDDEGYAIEVNGELQTLLQARTHRLVVAGHSHCPMARRFRESGLILINPGTLCREHDPGFAIADLRLETVQFYEFDSIANLIKSNSISIK